MTDLISMVVADDHPLFRQGVVSILQESGYFDVLAQAGNCDDAISLTEQYLPDMVLLDVSMPGGGIEAAEIISQSMPVVKIVMLTVSEHQQDVIKALNAQARGYILKGVGSTELIGILKGIYAGDSYISPTLAVELLIRGNAKTNRQDTVKAFNLNERERQILERLTVGMSNGDMAEELCISEKTVKYYMTNIMKKLEVDNRVKAAIKAYKLLL